MSQLSYMQLTQKDEPKFELMPKLCFTKVTWIMHSSYHHHCPIPPAPCVDMPIDRDWYLSSFHASWDYRQEPASAYYTSLLHVLSIHMLHSQTNRGLEWEWWRMFQNIAYQVTASLGRLFIQLNYAHNKWLLVNLLTSKTSHNKI